MGIRQVGNTKQLFRFNNNTKLMDVIDTLNGKIIKELPMENLQRVVDIKFIRNNRMIVADLAHNKCFIYDEINLDEWKLIRTIEKVDEITLSQPLGFAIDKSGEKFFLSDYDRKRILVFDMDGNCLHSYSENHSVLNPFGLDFDERSGLLYISDQQDNSIKVFE